MNETRQLPTHLVIEELRRLFITLLLQHMQSAIWDVLAHQRRRRIRLEPAAGAPSLNGGQFAAA